MDTERPLTTEEKLGTESAFPAGLAVGMDGGVFVSTEFAGAGGLTKREYFAALALQGLLTQRTLPPDGWSKMAVFQADDLLKELAK